MDTPHIQYIIFTGLDETLFHPGRSSIEDIKPALDLIQKQSIPLVLTSDKTANEILAYLDRLKRECFFIVESGAALYIPNKMLEVSYHHRVSDRYNIIEFGTARNKIKKTVTALCRQLGLEVIFLAEISPDDLKRMEVHVARDILDTARQRQYSEALVLKNNSADREIFDRALEGKHLRIKEHDDHLIITGDHDEGTAVRFLVQLYREEFPDRQIITIGLGSHWMDAPALYAVDKPVLLRRLNGKFDGRVGRRGMRFTRNPGPVGWNQAVISLLTGEEE
jgi:mannosyl-3-phosphoglycerate phosphatase